MREENGKMKILFAVLAATGIVIAYICAALYAKTRILIEYKNGRIRVKVRSRLFGYTFGKSARPHTEKAGKSRARREKSDSLNADGKSATDLKQKNTENTAEGFLKKIRRIKKEYKTYKKSAETLMTELCGTAEISDIDIRIDYGTGNAAHTGMLYGVFWGVSSALYAYVRRFLAVERPRVKITPEFNKSVFDADVSGIITVRPVHIIIAVYKAYSVFKKESGLGLADIIKARRAKASKA